MVHIKKSSETSTRNTEGSTVSLQSDDDILHTNRSESLWNPNCSVSSQHHLFSSSFSAVTPHKRKVNDLSDLTLDKLRIDSLGLHGRDDEKLRLLQDFGSLVKDSSTERRLHLIAGQSGTCKTKLNCSDDPTQLFGTSLSEAEFHMSNEETCWRAGVWFYRGVLYTYFGQHIPHAESSVEVGHRFFANAHIACPNNMMDAFLKGVSSCCAAARQTGKRKYAKLAKICRSKIKKWLDMGNPNVKHYELFLDAEDFAYRGKKVAAIKRYEAAILQAGIDCERQRSIGVAGVPWARCNTRPDVFRKDLVGHWCE